MSVNDPLTATREATGELTDRELLLIILAELREVKARAAVVHRQTTELRQFADRTDRAFAHLREKAATGVAGFLRGMKTLPGADPEGG